jgi:viroplasmin and RNaseH domain-containing protein
MSWYVVFRGYKTGVFSNRRECHASVNGFKGACYKGYMTEGEARAGYDNEKGDRRCDQQLGDYKVITKQDKQKCCLIKDVIIVV